MPKTTLPTVVGAGSTLTSASPPLVASTLVEPAKKRPSTPRKRVVAMLTGLLVSLTLLVGGLAYWFFVHEDTHDRSSSRRRDRDDDSKAKKEPREGPWSDSSCPVPVSSRDPVWGDRSAPVTIVVFSNFACERCKIVDKTLTLLRREYGQDRLRIVWKSVDDVKIHGPGLDPSAGVGPAGYAEAVFELAGNEGFWKFHDAALAGVGALDETTLAGLLKSAGVDQGAINRRRLDEGVIRKLKENGELAVRVGILETPTLFVNGKPVEPFAPIAKIESLVDDAEREAKAERARGTPAERIYVTLATRNFASPTPGPPKPPPILIGIDKTIYQVPIGDSPVLGARGATITIVEFGDYQCPFCKQAEATLTELLDKHDGDIRLVWKDNPLPSHKRAEPAAELARFVRSDLGDDAFWRLRRLMLSGSTTLEESELRVDAEIVGSDPDLAMAAVTESKFKAAIMKDQDLAADLGESATPTFYVNGRRLRGAHSLEQFEAVIAEETIRAKKMLADGVAPDDLYDALVRDGKKPASFETKVPPPIPKGAPSRGAKKPKITIVEFADFQCEACRKAEPMLAEVMSTYGDRVQIVWRNRPLTTHAEAELAAEAALEVRAQLGNDAFWRYHDKLLAAQDTPGGFDRAHLDEYATDVGCDMAKFKDALDSGKHKDAVERDKKDGDQLGLGEIPVFLVGNYVVGGDQPIARFKRAVDKALADAR